jgi:two-component system NtrC family sensor kinase
MDTIKQTDTSKCAPEIKKMITEVSNALERVQANVMQGAQVVKGLLKYSRTQDSAFEAVTLDQIIDGTLEMVQYKVKLSEIDLIRDYPKELPKIKGNLAQLEEVFFNFIDNAYDATVERKEKLKEPNYRGKITVSGRQKTEHTLEITFQDNGMGVKEEDMKKIFTPFFTTKISARQGTGLGLYVIKRIITDMHKGKIEFSSADKIGTRFIMELPIAKQGG